VLVHGPLSDPGRTTSAAIFDALGWKSCADAAEVHARWQAGQPAFMALDVLNLPLAGLLAVRRVLGLRNSGHTMAKLLPAVPGGLRVVNHTHPEYALSLAQYLRESAADAVLMRGTEGEPVADCRRQPRADVYLTGQVEAGLSLTPQEGVLVELPALPEAIDAASTAAHIQAVLEGRRPVPAPILRQADHLIATCRRIAAR
jgi:anthranilate phosphoribosyltransferase